MITMIQRLKIWRRLTFVITWLIYACFYFTRQSFGLAKVAFDNDPRIALSRNHFGMIDSAYLTTYMVGQFVFGALGDRFGPRRILLFGMTLSIAAAIASGFSTTILAFVVLAVFQGLAQSTGWSNTVKAMSSWFTSRERGRITGWWCTCYTVGPAAALPFAAWLMDYFGEERSDGQGGVVIVPYWQAAFWGPAAVLAVVLLLSWLYLRERPEDVGLPPVIDDNGQKDTIDSVSNVAEQVLPAPEDSWSITREVISSPSIWMLSLSYFSVKLTRYAFYFWGPKYIFESIGSDAYTSAMTAAALPIGGLVGVVGSGYVSDKLFQSRRAPVAILSLLMAAALMVVGLWPIQSLWLMGGFFFLVGVFLFGPDALISATAAVDVGTSRGAATATGFINGVGSFGGILGGYLPGVLTTEADWAELFGVFLISLVLSSMALLPLWNTKPSSA
jgi:OPA family sugar phosphate sensor protein UhpC-like MFS transporter